MVRRKTMVRAYRKRSGSEVQAYWRKKELEREATEHHMNQKQKKVYQALFTERFPKEPEGAYREEWAWRVANTDDYGLYHADSQTSRVIKKALKGQRVPTIR